MEPKDYYNFDDFFDANKKFEDFLSTCKIKMKEMPKGEELAISTITSVGQMATNVCFKYIFERISLDDHLVFVEYGKNKIRGEKKDIKIKKERKQKVTDKRKLNKGTPFSNLTFGIVCNHKEHNHKKPINIKLFNNGKLHMAGCKSREEINTMYNILYKKIMDIDTILFFNETKFIVDIGNFNEPKDYNYNIEMINGTYKCNFEIDLDSLYEVLNEKYPNEIFTDYEKSPLKCFLKLNENEVGTFSIYSSGSINIIAKTYDNIITSYNFIKNLVETHYKEIVTKEIIFDII
jgi:TATA-box binding protein (TBP) (component of TFIID and TFIIIB)